MSDACLAPLRTVCPTDWKATIALRDDGLNRQLEWSVGDCGQILPEVDAWFTMTMSTSLGHYPLTPSQ